jgi:hypothetical protein
MEVTLFDQSDYTGISSAINRLLCESRRSPIFLLKLSDAYDYNVSAMEMISYRSVVDITGIINNEKSMLSIKDSKVLDNQVCVEICFKLLSMRIVWYMDTLMGKMDSILWYPMLMRLGFQAMGVVNDKTGLNTFGYFNDRQYLTGLNDVKTLTQLELVANLRTMNIKSAFGAFVRAHSMRLAQMQSKMYVGLGDRRESIIMSDELKVISKHYGIYDVGLKAKDDVRIADRAYTEGGLQMALKVVTTALFAKNNNLTVCTMLKRPEWLRREVIWVQTLDRKRLKEKRIFAQTLLYVQSEPLNDHYYRIDAQEKCNDDFKWPLPWLDSDRLVLSYKKEKGEHLYIETDGPINGIISRAILYPEYNYKIEEKIYSIGVNRRNFVTDRVEMGLRFALFSVSNTYNRPDLAYVDLGIYDIATYPNMFIARRWTPGLYNIYHMKDYYTYNLIGQKASRMVKFSSSATKNIMHVDVRDKQIILFGYRICEDLTIEKDNSRYGYITKNAWPMVSDMVRYEYEFIVQVNKDESRYTDYVLDVNRINESFTGMHMRDYITLIRFNQLGEDNKVDVNSKSFDLTNELMELWTVVYRKQCLRQDIHIQTWWNSQTMWSKVMTIGLRKITSISEETMHALRRLIIRRIYPDAKIVKDKRINAILKNGQIIAVAGHLIGMMLAANFGRIDLDRYLNTIIQNLKMNKENKYPKEVKEYSQLGLMGESNYTTKMYAWHTWYDYSLAFIIFIQLCRLLSIKMQPIVLLKVMRAIITMRRYKQVKEGWQAKQWMDTR